MTRSDGRRTDHGRAADERRTDDVAIGLGGPEPVFLEVRVTEALVELIASRVAESLAARPAEADPGWLDVAAAARHLACPRSRIYALVHQRVIPFHKDGSRLLFRRGELDAWVEQGGGRRQ